jgi:hypothetical protein
LPTDLHGVRFVKLAALDIFRECRSDDEQQFLASVSVLREKDV